MPDRLEFDFEGSLGYRLLAASHAFSRAVNEELAPAGITYRQCQVLGCLAFESGLTLAELAERLHLEPPTLAGILDRMERDGWIVRRPCPDDRRKKRVYPTAEAGPVWSKMVLGGEAVESQAAAGLSEEEQAQLRRLLARVYENLEPTTVGAARP
jgi:MarR family transcriptional regulator for hemolysin